MKCKKVSAIIRTHKFGEVELRLKQIGVRGMTTFYVLGFGEETETDFFQSEQARKAFEVGNLDDGGQSAPGCQYDHRSRACWSCRRWHGLYRASG